MSRPLASLLLALACSAPSIASAHIHLTSPEARHTDPLEDQKEGPCGVAGSPRSATPTELVAGEFIEIAWSETIEHESYFRLAFLEDGDDFPDPEDFEVFCTPGEDAWCVADGIEDDQIEGEFSFVWSVPDTPCDNCTLQLIQVMLDGDGLQTDDLYFDCADIVILPPGGTSATTTTSGAGGGGDGGAAATTTSGAGGGGDGDGDGDGDTSAAGTGGAAATGATTGGATPEARTFPEEEGCRVAGGDAAVGLGVPLAVALGALALRRRRRG